MATALMVTFIQYGSARGESPTAVSITSQTLTFVDVGPAEKALQQLVEAHRGLDTEITGVILKDVII